MPTNIMSKPETTSLPKSQNNSHDNLLLSTENALKTQLELNEKLKSKIISLKSSISYYKNESFEFTENMTRQNELFLGWQEQVKEELKFLVSILSGRQKNKYEAWKREVREREAICKKVQKVSINSSASCSNLLTSDADGQNSPSLNLVPNSFAMCFSNGGASGVYPRQSGVKPSPSTSSITTENLNISNHSDVNNSTRSSSVWSLLSRNNNITPTPSPTRSTSVASTWASCV